MSMPSRASTSLLQKGDLTGIDPILACQCPHGLVPHCYKVLMKTAAEQYEDVSMPSRASTSLLQKIDKINELICRQCVNALTG